MDSNGDEVCTLEMSMEEYKHLEACATRVGVDMEGFINKALKMLVDEAEDGQ